MTQFQCLCAKNENKRAIFILLTFDFIIVILLTNGLICKGYLNMALNAAVMNTMLNFRNEFTTFT